MISRLCLRTFLTTALADVLDLFRGRVDQDNRASINAVRGFSLVHDPAGLNCRVGAVRHTLN